MDKMIMIIGLPILDNRIAPVFDVARELLLVCVDDGVVIQQELLVLPRAANEKVIKLVDASVNVLLCGAISNWLESTVKMNNIQILSFLKGDVQSVIKAWLAGNLNDLEFVMPGCQGSAGSGNGCRKRFRHGKEQCQQSSVIGNRNEDQNSILGSF